MAFERTEGSRPARPMRRGRKKVCSFCVDRIDTIDYKDVPRLRKYVSERAKIIPRKEGDTARTRGFFEHYRNQLLPLKREWFRNREDTTFLQTDGLTAEQEGEAVCKKVVSSRFRNHSRFSGRSWFR